MVGILLLKRFLWGEWLKSFLVRFKYLKGAIMVMAKSLTSKLRQTNKGFPRKSSDSVDPFVSMTEKRAKDDVESIAEDTDVIDSSVADAEADVKEYVKDLEKERVEENKEPVEVSDDRKDFFEDVMFGAKEDTPLQTGEVSDTASPESSSVEPVSQGVVVEPVGVVETKKVEVVSDDVGNSDPGVLYDIERRIKAKEPVSKSELILYNEAVSQSYG